jgi:dTDP-4-amino-4,6-dideoxygalactose transaminase
VTDANQSMPESILLTADPKAGFVAHAESIRAAIDRVLASGHYILGSEVEAFEREFAVYHGSGFVVGVANGTDALELALRAVGVGRGDLVVTVANTVSATVAAIEQIGAVPVYVEIDPATLVMSSAALEQALSSATRPVKAVVPVHLYGQPADLPEIIAAAARHGAKVVEDCAQSHGATFAGRKAGTFGDAAAYSFYPTKNLGALGDGGGVYTRDGGTAERVRLLRQYGWRERYVSSIPGRNSRLDELQAAVLRVKLQHLDAENAHRSMLAERYMAQLEASGLGLPVVAKAAKPVWHQFTIRCERRDALRTHLATRGIHCGVLYPTPLYQQPAYAQPGVSLPTTERACAEVLSLPVHPAVTVEDVDRVCAEIIRWKRS